MRYLGRSRAWRKSRLCGRGHSSGGQGTGDAAIAPDRRGQERRSRRAFAFHGDDRPAGQLQAGRVVGRARRTNAESATCNIRRSRKRRGSSARIAAARRRFLIRRKSRRSASQEMMRLCCSFSRWRGCRSQTGVPRRIMAQLEVGGGKIDVIFASAPGDRCANLFSTGSLHRRAR